MKISEVYSDVLTEDLKYEFKSVLNPDNPVKWAKTIVAYANGEGGILFVGVSEQREAFGIDLDEIDNTKNLVARVNDRHIFPHAKIRYMMRSVDDNAERYVLGIQVSPSDSVVRYCEGDFNETVYIKGDGYSAPATPEEIISLSKRKFGIDNETTDILYDEKEWSEYMSLCREFREGGSLPDIKELINEEIVSKDGYAKSGLVMFKDNYDSDDTLICCRLWDGRNKVGTVLDSARFKGPLPYVLRNALAFMERNTSTGWRKTPSGGREEIRAYPKEALREALVNAIAHRDYSISGTQIDIDIYKDRIDIVSPGSWLLPRKYEDYPLGSIPSIRRNAVIAACLYVADLMERGGTGFQTMMASYKDCSEDKQPCVLVYPGFLDLRLFDRLYKEVRYDLHMSDSERVLDVVREEPRSVKYLQSLTKYKSRSRFLEEVLDPLIEAGEIYRDGNLKSPKALIRKK